MPLLPHTDVRSSKPSNRTDSNTPADFATVAGWAIYYELIEVSNYAEFYRLLTLISEVARQRCVGQPLSNDLIQSEFGLTVDLTGLVFEIVDQQKYLVFVLQSGITVDQFVKDTV